MSHRSFLTPGISPLSPGIYRSRPGFAVALRQARQHKTLSSYERDGVWRRATIAGRWVIYEPAYYSMLQRDRHEDDGRTYDDPRDERAERRS